MLITQLSPIDRGQARLARPYLEGLFENSAAARIERWTQRPQQVNLPHLAPMGSRVAFMFVCVAAGGLAMKKVLISSNDQMSVAPPDCFFHDWQQGAIAKMGAVCKAA